MQETGFDRHISPTAANFNRLSLAQRASAAQRKYAAAVAMYAATDLTLRRVADACGVTAAGLSAYMGRHHRSLLYARYGLDAGEGASASVVIRPAKGQSLKTHQKYREAVMACGDIAYIEYNVSQVAAMFGLGGPALAAQLRVHYPDVIPHREQLRRQLGMADNTPRGPRRTSREAYEAAMAMYRDTDLTLPEVAERCDVSKSGLCQFMRFYHKDIPAEKAARRKAAGESAPQSGALSGNGRLYGPKAETDARYAEAMELLRTTDMPLREIIARTGVPMGGFRGYLKRWHADELQRPRGRNASAGKRTAKEPKLTSHDKYRQAVSEYAASAESLQSIARRHGLVYKSLASYVKRNCPTETESHARTVAEAGMK